MLERIKGMFLSARVQRNWRGSVSLSLASFQMRRAAWGGCDSCDVRQCVQFERHGLWVWRASVKGGRLCHEGFATRCVGVGLLGAVVLGGCCWEWDSVVGLRV